MTFTKLKYGVIITTSIASLTGSLVWFVTRPRIELVDIVHLTMAVQERLRATQVLATYPSNRVWSVTNNYVVWQECSDTNAIYYTYGPWVTNVISATNGTPAITNIYEIVTTNRYLVPSGAYESVVETVESMYPETRWNGNYEYEIQDGRKFIYAGYSNYVVNGFTHGGAGVNGTYGYTGTAGSYTNIANSNFTLTISFANQSGAVILLAEPPYGAWYTIPAGDYNTHELVGVAQWFNWDDSAIESGGTVVGSGGLMYGRIGTNTPIIVGTICDAGVYTNRTVKDSLVIGAYVDSDLLSDLSYEVRQLYSSGFSPYGEIYEWFTPYYTNTSTDAEIVDGIYTQYMCISGYNPNGSYYLKASDSLDGETGLENVFIRGYDTWMKANYGPVFLDRINYSANEVGEAYLFLRFSDESTNYVTESAYQYWLDKVNVPYLYETNWSKRYDALYRLGNYTKKHVQTWTTNSTANQYQWSGAETTTYDLAVASCIAAAPTTTTNAGSPYRYTLVNKIMTFDAGSTTWQAYAYARICYPSVSGMATSLTKHVDFYMQTIPRSHWYSLEGYGTNEYTRLPDESYDAGSAFSYTSTSVVGTVSGFASPAFFPEALATNQGFFIAHYYQGWQCGDVGPIIKWDFQYCTNAIP